MCEPRPCSKHFELFVADLRAGGDPKLLVYALEAFEALVGDEREQAIALLFDRVQQRDWRAVQTLAAAEVQEAVPVLERYVTDPNASFRASVNRALACLVKSPEALARLAQELVSGHPIQAAFSAYSLAELDVDGAIQGLLAGLSSPFLPARINSYRGLFERFGLKSLAEPLQSPLWALCLAIGGKFPTMIDRGAAALRAIVAQLVAGASPEALDLEYRPGDPELVKRFWTSMQQSDAALDLDALRTMCGHDRQWAEAQLINRLGWEDPRAAKAIVALQLEYAYPVLDEALELFCASKVEGLREAIVAAMALR